ncbi:hypothetical protein Bbelb_095940 [Branchiostoma belcheri]|nr:hypothetical protein Bbelb_095940 [Branchiostoma belcheri]
MARPPNTPPCRALPDGPRTWDLFRDFLRPATNRNGVCEMRSRVPVRPLCTTTYRPVRHLCTVRSARDYLSPTSARIHHKDGAAVAQDGVHVCVSYLT